MVDTCNVLILSVRLNKQLNEDEMEFQDEGGLLLPPTIEQKVSSTGTLAEHNSSANFFC